MQHERDVIFFRFKFWNSSLFRDHIFVWILGIWINFRISIIELYKVFFFNIASFELMLSSVYRWFYYWQLGFCILYERLLCYFQMSESPVVLLNAISFIYRNFTLKNFKPFNRLWILHGFLVLSVGLYIYSPFHNLSCFLLLFFLPNILYILKKKFFSF